MTVVTQLTGTTLILGGARSGKSAYAEKLVLASQLRPIYIATAEACDDEMQTRIAHHISRRGRDWTTIEQPLGLCEALMSHAAPENAILVDCLTLWLSNLMQANKNIEEETMRLATLIPGLAGPVVFVANEVGMGLVPETALGREFRDCAGRLNQLIAHAADTVNFIAAGYPLSLKAKRKTENKS